MEYVHLLLFFSFGALCHYIYVAKIASGSGKLTNEHKDKLPAEIDAALDKEMNTDLVEQKEEIRLGSKFVQLQRTLDDLFIVNDLGQRVTSSLNMSETFRLLHTTINSMMDAAVLELRIINHESGIWKVYSTLNLADGPALQDYNHLAAWCSRNQREVFLADAENDFERYVFTPLTLPDGRVVKSALVFPIAHNTNVSGTLSILSFQKNTYEDYHRKIIRLLLGYISVAMQNALTHEELSITKQRAERSEKFMQQFLANMSHEIRTPINAVTGMSRLLLEKSPRTDQLSYLASIQNASDSLLVIINDILDLSKIEAGKIELENIEFSLPELVRHVQEIIHFKAEEKGLILKTELDQNLPPVLIGDPTRLKQILINLMGNAVKFTHKGTVTLMISQHLPEKLQENSGLENHIHRVGVKFVISDTGIGMNEAQQQKLFMDYMQASAETSRKYGGTGLGLSISKQLVQLQGGRIDVKSKEGLGSVFSFVLNYTVSKNKKVQQNEQVVSEEMLRQMKGIRVLIADDNEYNRIIARETLQLRIEDIMIDEALDGQMAVSLIKTYDYDLILMDLVMPKSDGYEATRIIRTQLNSPKKNIPILALTASVVKSEIERSREAGMNGFIPKPFKSFEMIAVMYQALFGNAQSSFVDHPVFKEAPAPDGKLIQYTYLLDYAEGDEDRVQRFIELFLFKTPIALDKLNKALIALDFDTIRITAHSLKPNFRSIGLLQGLELLDKIEESATSGSETQPIDVLIKSLTTLYQAAAEEMKML